MKVDAVEEVYNLSDVSTSADPELLRDIFGGYIKAALRCAFNKSSVDSHCTIRKSPRIGVIANEVLMRAGVIEAIQPESPLAILVWGIKRVLPVRLTGFTITEEMFDPDLNPTHAKVSLDLNVLSYHDLGLLSPGGGLFMAHQIIKEGMATINGVGAAIGAAANFSVSIG